MKIEQITKYRVNGQEFATVAKAQDYVDGEVNKLLQKGILAQKMNMIGIRDIGSITEVLLVNRKQFAELLSCEFRNSEENWD